MGAAELGKLETLVRQHLRVVARIEQLAQQAAQYDTAPSELPELEREAERLRLEVVATLKTWLERLE